MTIGKATYKNGLAVLALVVCFLIAGFNIDRHFFSGNSGFVKNQNPWEMHAIDPMPASGSDGVKLADINMDGNPDIVLSFEEEGKLATLPFGAYKSNGKHSVIWGSYQDDPFSGNWDFLPVSGLKGRKFDLVNLIDLDRDGYLDVLTNDENEEGDGLGVVWYENPYKRIK